MFFRQNYEKVLTGVRECGRIHREEVSGEGDPLNLCMSWAHHELCMHRTY